MANPKKYLLQTCKPLSWDDCDSMLKAVIAEPEIRQNKYGKKAWDVYWNENVQLTDCSRTIGWSFDSGNGPDVAKAGALLDWARALHAALEKARVKYDKAKAECARRNVAEGRDKEDDL